MAQLSSIETDRVIKTLPCIRCGYCCLKVPCGVSVAKYDMTYRYTNVRFDSGQMKMINMNPCPALKFDGKNYSCIHAEEYKKELAIGQGCTSGLNSQRKAKIERILNEQWSR